MKSGFVRVTTPMADPSPPQPMPFPIKIVNDSPSPVSETSDDEGISTNNRTDYFYKAWDKFLAIEPKRAKKLSRTAKRVEEEKAEVAESNGDGLKVEGNAAHSWEQAAAECKCKVAAIVHECKRLNQKYRDALFDLEASPYSLQKLTGQYPKAVQNIDAPPWVKRVEDIFDDPQFFIDGATAQDVHQGSGGDCWFLAALMAVSAKKDLIEALCVARDEKVGVYGFVFYRDGEWIYEVIDDKLFLRVGDDDALHIVRDWQKDKKEGISLKHNEEKLLSQLQRGGEALYFSHCKSNETWLPLIEKAYAKAHGDYASIEGGFASEAIEDLTGGVGVNINPEDIMDKERFWREQLSQVNEKYLFGGGSKATGSKGFVGGHAYAVLRAWEEGELKLLKLRNPWGEVEWEGDWSDGSKLWTPAMMTKLDHTFGDDGVFWISYQDFLKHFPSINRVRLFNRDWEVAQRWTAVNVPWTVDYLDTKFQITLTKACPVVIVLSQPDDRYFYGLRGRYLYSLHFRVYRAGEEGGGWIVRSMHNSGNETIFTRSVSAEIEDLEPGTYDVVFKVTAVRAGGITAEEAIMKFAVERKEKLLHVGRRFDFAQSKGNLKGMEEGKRRRERRERFVGLREGLRRERVDGLREKERARLRRGRVEEAMRGKRRAWRERCKVRAVEKKERSEARRKERDEKDKLTPDGSVDGKNGGEEVNVSAEGGAQEVQQDVDPKPSDNDTPEGKPSDAPSPTNEPNDLTTPMSNLRLSTRRTNTTTPSPTDDPPSDSDSSPFEPPEEMDDDDFEWDSDIDGPPSPLDSDSSRRGSSAGIFGNDPWNAICVLGLRIYSRDARVEVRVVRGEDGG